MKDRCKLFCRVAGNTAYYQLRDRVIDGTPCGPDTNDICVQGLCRVTIFPSLCNDGLHFVGQGGTFLYGKDELREVFSS